MKLIFDGSEGDFLPKEEAKLGIENYKTSSTFALNNGVKGFLFGRNKIEEILSQNGCLGIRIYYGYEQGTNNTLKPQLYIVGTDQNGDDMIEMVLDRSFPCPQTCPINAALDD